MKSRFEDWLHIHWGLQVSLPGYFLMLCVSIAVGCWLVIRFSRRYGLHERAVYSFLCLSIPMLFLGSKLLYALQFPSVLSKGWDFWLGAGASLYGGLVGAALAAFLVFRYYRLSAWAYLDCLAPALGLGLGITRLGCFLGGCNWGTLTEQSWGVCFPRESLAFNQQVRDRLISSDAWLSLPVHPTQLYESGAGFALFLLGVLWMRRRRFEGEVFLGLLAGYSVVRFLVEFVRADYHREFWASLTFAQWVSVLLLLVCAGLWALRRVGAERQRSQRVGFEPGRFLSG